MSTIPSLTTSPCFLQERSRWLKPRSQVLWPMPYRNLSTTPCLTALSAKMWWSTQKSVEDARKDSVRRALLTISSNYRTVTTPFSARIVERKTSSQLSHIHLSWRLWSISRFSAWIIKQAARYASHTQTGVSTRLHATTLRWSAPTSAVRRRCSRKITRHTHKPASSRQRSAPNATSAWQMEWTNAIAVSRTWRSALKTSRPSTSAWSRKWTRSKSIKRTQTLNMETSGYDARSTWKHSKQSSSTHSLDGNRHAQSWSRTCLPTWGPWSSSLDLQTSMLGPTTTIFGSTRRAQKKRST